MVVCCWENCKKTGVNEISKKMKIFICGCDELKYIFILFVNNNKK
jgi:hypothetical protein